MKPVRTRVAGAFVIIALVCGIPPITTRLEQRSIRQPERILKEIGYSFPSHTQIVKTEAMIWSLADGDNYRWVIKSDKSLLSWAESVAFRREEDGLYRVVKKMPDGREETSYIDLLNGDHVAEIWTFRP